MTERERARRRIAGSALLVSALGWAAYLAVPADAGLAFCRGEGTAWSWSSLRVLLDVAPLSSLAASWTLMLIAMMVPTLIAPLLHVHQRSFRQRRARSITLFVIGYAVVWLLAGAVLILLQWLLSVAAPQSLWPAAAAALIALAWQCSPAKQLCLNRSHNHYELSAFGFAADRDAFGFGLSHGLWCIGSCWALMLLPMLLIRGHTLAMVAVTVLMAAERLEGPRPLRWQLRGLGKLTRIVCAQARAVRAQLRQTEAAKAGARTSH